MKNGIRRIHLLDELRGFAIICMVVHHAFFDAGFVLGSQTGYKIFDALCVFQPIFWTIFIVISGICSRLSKNTVRRGIIVFAAGGAVTLVTAVIMPLINITGAQIYFGVLSCLGSCMIITGLFMKLIEKVNEKIGMAVSFALFLLTYSVSDKSLLFGLIKLPETLYQSNALAPLGFYSSTFASADYFPFCLGFLCFFSVPFSANMQRTRPCPNRFIKADANYFPK